MTIVQLIDDLDGTPGEDIATITFSLDGVDYEIDLAEVNAERLRKSLEEFVTAGRRTGGRVKRGPAPRSTAQGAGRSKYETKAIRDWAQANGYEVAGRGRIPANVIEAYQAAEHASSPTSASSDDKPKRGRKPVTAAFSG
ncbi:histone-like nucleoid-structuring protein Lsr2 [Actinokineospora fastidiosa]|nr:Lsr2 family protein [Actinokineospora fastidiosa]